MYCGLKGFYISAFAFMGLGVKSSETDSLVRSWFGLKQLRRLLKQKSGML